MPNKCDVLREARDQVADKGKIRCRYFNGECYCAVGYVLKGLGLTDDELDELVNCSINSIWYKGSMSVNDLFVKVYNAINDAGIDIAVLTHLQEINDDDTSNEFVVSVFDEMLVEANCQ